MKATWIRIARRINALSLRERVIMGFSLAAAVAAMADFFVLTPQLAAQRTLLQHQRSEAAELQTLRVQLAAPAAETPLTRLRQAVESARAELAAVDSELALHLAGRAEAAQLPDLLRQVLRRHERLMLVRLDAVPAAASAASAGSGTHRGVEIQLAGRYADLSAYASEIEGSLPGLQWTSLQIDGHVQPPLLSARLWMAGGTP